MSLIGCLNPGPYGLIVKSGVLIPFPRIDREATGSATQAERSLAKREIGYAVKRTQFDKCPRPDRLHNPHCERSIFNPR